MLRKSYVVMRVWTIFGVWTCEKKPRKKAEEKRKALSGLLFSRSAKGKGLCLTAIRLDLLALTFWLI